MDNKKDDKSTTQTKSYGAQPNIQVNAHKQILPQFNKSAVKTLIPIRKKKLVPALKKTLLPKKKDEQDYFKRSLKHKEQKVAVLVDVQNMYYSARNLYDGKVNFKEILQLAVSGRKLMRAFAYVVKADVKYEDSFFTALEQIGFEVRVKDLQVFFGGHKKGDWDVGIAMDAVRLASKVDTIVLVSGDGDFVDMIEYLQGNGCKVELVAFGKSASSRVKDAADEFYNLDEYSKKFLIK